MSTLVSRVAPPPPGLAASSSAPGVAESDSVASIARPISQFISPSTTIDELASYLLDHQVTSVAVANRCGDVIGFASMTDVVRRHVRTGSAHGRPYVEPKQPPRVRDTMMPFLHTLPPRATIVQAAALLASFGVNQLLVISRLGDLIGIVRARDVLRALARRLGAFVLDDADEMWRKSCESAT